MSGVAVIGPGRVGRSLARALSTAGMEVDLLGRRAVVAPLPACVPFWEPALARATLILVAVPDDHITDVARRAAQSGAIGPAHTVLHTSGLRDRLALAPLESCGAALGSWHPLQTFSDPDGEPGLLAHAPAIIEGDARALAAGRELAAVLGSAPVVEARREEKPAYHAAAVFASNYLVVLGDVAARLAREALAAPVPDGLFAPLMRQTLANLAADPAAALTGPIRRGDVETIAEHLRVLRDPERALYIALGLQALRLAVASGLAADRAAMIERLLTGR